MTDHRCPFTAGELFAVGAIAEARLSGAEPAIVLVGTVPATIPVSRRMLPAVREALVRAREAGR